MRDNAEIRVLHMPLQYKDMQMYRPRGRTETRIEELTQILVQ